MCSPVDRAGRVSSVNILVCFRLESCTKAATVSVQKSRVVLVLVICLFVFSLFLTFSVLTFINRMIINLLCYAYTVEISRDCLFVRFLSLFVVIMTVRFGLVVMGGVGVGGGGLLWGGGGCYGGVCSINLYSLVAVEVILIYRLRFRVINIPKFMISVKL